ncbi:MAG: hypothetical protein HRF44_02265 [Ignavibacterium sp.]|jgi:hypothetical protein
MRRLFLLFGVAICATLIAPGLASAQERTQTRQQVTFAVLKTHGSDIASLSPRRVTVSSVAPNPAVRASVHTLVSGGRSIARWVRLHETISEPSSKKLIITITD